MNKTTQRVVIIDNISSPYIEQAIIILRDFSASNQAKVIADAEKVVRDYLEKMKTDDSDITLYSRPSVKKRKKSNKLIKLAIFSLFTVAVIVAINYLI